MPPAIFKKNPEITNIGNNLFIEDVIYGVGDGYHLGIIRIIQKTPRHVFGFLEYTLFDDGKFKIDLIEVRREHRRQGYATMMLKYATKVYGDLNWGVLLPDGKYLKESKKYERDRKYKHKKPKLKRTTTKHK